jgi:hypothetical protein
MKPAEQRGMPPHSIPTTKPAQPIITAGRQWNGRSITPAMVNR